MSDKIEEIRDRVEQDVAKGPANKEIYLVHKDRAFLLAEVENQRAENERLREALQESACACSSIRECVSECAKDGKCPHLIARNALEGKP